jgi:hypothetical protein
MNEWKNNYDFLSLDSKYYWTKESLDFAYVWACVDIAKKRSVKAANLYRGIVECWNNPDLINTFKDFYSEITSYLSEDQKNDIPLMILQPEKYIKGDIDTPLRNLKNISGDQDIAEYVLSFLFENDSLERQNGALVEFILKIFEFILVAFNNKENLEKGKYKVFLSDLNQYVHLAVMFMSSLEHYSITRDRVIELYKVRLVRGKKLNFENILQKKPTSRIHRRIIANAKSSRIKLKHDRTIYKASEHWYECRVINKSINEFLSKEDNPGLDLKNIQKEIKPIDVAMGYIKRRKSKTK